MERDFTDQTLALIGCGKKKREFACEARELYAGPLFAAQRDWAEANADAYFIASAKHILLTPEQVIEPYDLSMRDLPADKRRDRANQIRGQFHGRWIEYCEFAKSGPRPEDPRIAVKRPRVVLLAGADYLTGFFDNRQRGFDGMGFETPLQGLGIGQQLQWLRRKVTADAGQLLLPFSDA